MNVADHLAVRRTTAHTPQDAPIPGREGDMVRNDAGGFSFAVDDWMRLQRFLVLGSEGGTYYVGERELTVDNARAVVRCLHADGRRVVAETSRISASGRAPKNDHAILVLAMAAAYGVRSAAGAGRTDTSDPGDGLDGLLAGRGRGYAAAVRKAALAELSHVARTGSHLLQFIDVVTRFRGWGRALRRAVGESWYKLRDADGLALQLLKYRNRHGWTHRDVLRLAHPDPGDMSAPARAAVAWTLARDAGDRRALDAPDLDDRMAAADRLRELAADSDRDRAAAPDVIRRHALPREVVPGELLGDAATWDAVLESMPLTATLRTLNRMTRVGVLESGSEATRHVADRLRDREQIRRARIHPIQVLLALRTYASGGGARGGLSWRPVPEVSDALDEAFRLSFETLEATGKRFRLGVDVSGSMCAPVMNGVLTCYEAAAAMAVSISAAEGGAEAVAFTAGSRGFSPKRPASLTPLDVSPRRRLDDVVREARELRFGGTDCALPITDALDRGEARDVFVVLTDNETWADDVHPAEALRRYRRETGINARLAVVAMTSTGFSIADPDDTGMLDACGFDASLPRVLAEFASGNV